MPQVQDAVNHVPERRSRESWTPREVFDQYVQSYKTASSPSRTPPPRAPPSSPAPTSTAGWISATSARTRSVPPPSPQSTLRWQVRRRPSAAATTFSQQQQQNRSLPPNRPSAARVSSARSQGRPNHASPMTSDTQRVPQIYNTLRKDHQVRRFCRSDA